MKKLFIIKVGTTFPATAEQYGDFDTWTLDGLGAAEVDTCILDAENGAALPPAADCAGVVVTGSHAMVTDNLPWSRNMEAWIPTLVDSGVPFLGICYGHQLLARSMGGEVGYHLGGQEIGTVEIQLLPESAQDALLHSLPPRFYVHATHAQSVLRLPPGATRLAANAYERHHIFRVGRRAWGVQFHPEYDGRIMRSYIREQAEALASAGRKVPELIDAVRETPTAEQVLRNFARLATGQDTVAAPNGSMT